VSKRMAATRPLSHLFNHRLDGRLPHDEPRRDDGLEGGAAYVLLPSSWIGRMNSFSRQQHVMRNTNEEHMQ
jgi:hypothetical protein